MIPETKVFHFWPKEERTTDEQEESEKYNQAKQVTLFTCQSEFLLYIVKPSSTKLDKQLGRQLPTLKANKLTHISCDYFLCY